MLLVLIQKVARVHEGYLRIGACLALVRFFSRVIAAVSKLLVYGVVKIS